MANEYLARLRALQTPQVESDDELKATGKRELADAKGQLEKAIRRAYQHVVYVYQPDPGADRSLDQITFDDDHHTALDGTLVWKALVDREKAFNNSEFTAKALLHNLREQDYGRPLPEVRDAFWKTPRLPLLYAGDTDLQHAIYRAVQAGDLCIVDANDSDVEVTDPAQVNLSSMGLRLAKPRGDAQGDGAHGRGGSAAPGEPGSFAGRAGHGTGTLNTPDSTESDGEDESTAAAEKFLSFPLVGALLDNPDKADALAQVFRILYSVLDENKVSYAQGTLQLVLDAEAANKLAAATRELGINVTMRDQ